MTVYEKAKQVIEQWENHDRHRTIPGDNLLWSNGQEPDNVMLAREVVRLTETCRTPTATV